jgi:thiamine biosynthesis lipoprotein
VHRWTWRVLRDCRTLHRGSGGAFDPTVAAALVRRGSLPAPQGPLPDPAATFDDVHLLPDGRVAYARPLWLDLGGVARGFAVDLALAALRCGGIRQACVNAGGDLRVMGARPVPVRLRDPRQPGRSVALGGLRQGACATSGAYFSARPGTWDILCPQGRPDPGADTDTVTVLAPRCALADGLTKVVALRGVAGAQALLGRLRASAFTGLPAP